ncbi:SRPBCC domain-containing protein [Pseudaestuariivita sp.]|uniref:SRPBCC domain-containing protein n=1 Tax=Pseudaestuariivita sp. TaxID=2211669 RepID=UPI004059B30E
MSATTLTLTREIAASPGTVWRCLTDPALVAQWFAPAPVSVTHCEIDAVPGGIFHAIMHVPEMGEMDGGPGCVLVADAQTRLVWTSALGPGFVPAAPPEEGQFQFTADITLEPSAQNGTRYTVRALHHDAASAAAHDAMGFQSGWGAAADQLATLAANQETTP